MAGPGAEVGLAHKMSWWIKLTLKLILARLPVGYGFWRRLGLFRHGEMNVPERAIDTFHAYHERACRFVTLPDTFKCLELGPGDSVLSGLVARAYGAERAWLVDAGQFADTDVGACRRVLDLLRARGRAVPDLGDAADLNAVLDRAGVDYLTNGTESLAEIPDGTIDFFWSQVVLEHVPRAEFRRFIEELRRVVTADGIGVHSVDFRDHLGGGLNNLRFSEAVWEGELFKSSGFYTNRIRPSEMLAVFEEAGFSVALLDETRWPEMPLARASLAPAFRTFSDDDLMIAEMEIVLRPKRRVT